MMIRVERNAWILTWCFVFTVPLLMPRIRGDGNGYYSYLRSMFIDHDLQFENEFRHSDPAFQSVVFDEHGKVRAQMRTPTQHIRNQWAVGASLLWAPFFLAAHAGVGLLRLLGLSWEVDGYSVPYLVLCGFGTTVYSFAGLLLSYNMAKRLVTPGWALLATLAIWFASPLPVYMYFLPFHVHALCAFAVSAFLWQWLRTRPDWTLRQCTILGLFAGLMIEVYYLNAILLLIPAADIAMGCVQKGETSSTSSRAKFALRILAIACGAIIALIPHFVIKAIIHGSPWRAGYADRFFWGSPRLWQVGFSPEHGMFLWTPVLLPATIGLVLLYRRNRPISVALLVGFAALYYLIASYQNWHGQSSFGSRFFVSYTPAFVLGLAVFMEDVTKGLANVSRTTSSDRKRVVSASRLQFAAPFLVALIVTWNIGLIFQWGANVVPNRGSVDLAVMATNQFTVVPGRLRDFLWRYFTERGQLASEIEQQDSAEQKGYQVSR